MRSLGLTALLSAVAVAVSGCALLRPASTEPPIEELATEALIEAGITGGVERFDNSAGFGQAFQFLVCVEIPDGAADEQIVDVIDRTLGILVPIAEDADLDAIGIHVVEESAGAEGFTNWCRDAGFGGSLSLEDIPVLAEVGEARGGTVYFRPPYPSLAEAAAALEAAEASEVEGEAEEHLTEEAEEG